MFDTNLEDIFGGTDSKLEKEGVWYNVSETMGFKLRRNGGANDSAVKAAGLKFHAPYAAAIASKTITDEQQKKIWISVLVHSCLADWKGVMKKIPVLDEEGKQVVDEDGKPVIKLEEVPFNKETAIELFMKFDALWIPMVDFTKDRTNYKSTREEVGNS